MTEAPSSIWIITEEPSSEGARESKDVGGSISPKQSQPLVDTRKALPVEKLKKEMDDFLSKIGDIFSHAEQQLERQRVSMQLDEVELSIEINAEGQVSLFGIGGKTGSKGAITLKFKRKESARND